MASIHSALYGRSFPILLVHRLCLALTCFFYHWSSRDQSERLRFLSACDSHIQREFLLSWIFICIVVRELTQKQQVVSTLHFVPVVNSFILLSSLPDIHFWIWASGANGCKHRVWSFSSAARLLLCPENHLAASMKRATTVSGREQLENCLLCQSHDSKRPHAVQTVAMKESVWSAQEGTNQCENSK